MTDKINRLLCNLIAFSFGILMLLMVWRMLEAHKEEAKATQAIYEYLHGSDIEIELYE